MISDRPALPHIGDDEPIRLSVAAALAFPDGSMTASGLRREAARGRLTIERIAGKDFTTIRAINQMRERCRVTAKVQDSGCSHHDETNTVASSNKPCGSSATAASNEALVSARAKLRKLSERSPITSPPNTAPLESATVTPLPAKIADVVAIYAEDVAHKHARPQETSAR
jgi:hypothetical protein